MKVQNLFVRQWNLLKNSFHAQRLSHAYLLVGRELAKIENFAKDFLKYIYCSENEKPCNQCYFCRAVGKEILPDLKIIKREEGRKEIEISQIREIEQFLILKSYGGKLKSVIIKEAHFMNQESQSCFLKTLEEPRGDTLFFLITSYPEVLLPTIFSRCQIIKFIRKDEEGGVEEEKILRELSRVLPLPLVDKFKYVSSLNLQPQETLKIIRIIQTQLRELLLFKVMREALKSNEKKRIFQEKSYTIDKLIELLELTQQLEKDLSFYYINPKLSLEILLMNL